MTAPHCIKPDSITITASIAACIGCWCVATGPTERLCEKVHSGTTRFESARPPHRAHGQLDRRNAQRFAWHKADVVPGRKRGVALLQFVPKAIEPLGTAGRRDHLSYRRTLRRPGLSREADLSRPSSPDCASIQAYPRAAAADACRA